MRSSIVVLLSLMVGFVGVVGIAACSSDDAPSGSTDGGTSEASTDSATDGTTTPIDSAVPDSNPDPVRCLGTGGVACTGCCRGKICIAVPNDDQCGKNGTTCASCTTSFQVCNTSTGQCE